MSLSGGRREAMAPAYPQLQLRPPRNPRETASIAAAVMVLVAGMFALIFGNVILYYDAFSTGFDPDSGNEFTAISTGPFVSGVLYLTAFAMSLVGAYCALRLVRYELAVAGPVTLLVAFFGSVLDNVWILLASAHILVLSIVALSLVYYAIPIFSGRKARVPVPAYASLAPSRGDRSGPWEDLRRDGE